jgi:hypothetical protein
VIEGNAEAAMLKVYMEAFILCSLKKEAAACPRQQVKRQSLQEQLQQGQTLRRNFPCFPAP